MIMNNLLIQEVEELLNEVAEKVQLFQDEIPLNKAQGSSWH